MIHVIRINYYRQYLIIEPNIFSCIFPKEVSKFINKLISLFTRETEIVILIYSSMDRKKACG